MSIRCIHSENDDPSNKLRKSIIKYICAKIRAQVMFSAQQTKNAVWLIWNFVNVSWYHCLEWMHKPVFSVDTLVSNLVSKLFPQFNHKIYITFLRQVSVEHTPSRNFALSFRYLLWNHILFPIHNILVCSLSFLCLLISYPFLKINITHFIKYLVLPGIFNPILCCLADNKEVCNIGWKRDKQKRIPSLLHCLYRFMKEIVMTRGWKTSRGVTKTRM